MRRKTSSPTREQPDTMTSNIGLHNHKDTSMELDCDSSNFLFTQGPYLSAEAGSVSSGASGSLDSFLRTFGDRPTHYQDPDHVQQWASSSANNFRDEDFGNLGLADTVLMNSVDMTLTSTTQESMPAMLSRTEDRLSTSKCQFASGTAALDIPLSGSMWPTKSPAAGWSSNTADFSLSNELSSDGKWSINMMHSEQDDTLASSFKPIQTAWSSPNVESVEPSSLTSSYTQPTELSAFMESPNPYSVHDGSSDEEQLLSPLELESPIQNYSVPFSFNSMLESASAPQCLSSSVDSAENEYWLTEDPIQFGEPEKIPQKRHSPHPDNFNARKDQLYYIVPGEDGLFHCPFADKGCTHKPDKLKCNYDKHLDSHLKPYRCKQADCATTRFSSTACLLRHEREAHGMHGHGEKPYMCSFDDCDRAQPGHGFPRRWNLRDHMKRVHNYTGPVKGEPVSISEAATGVTASKVAQVQQRKKRNSISTGSAAGVTATAAPRKFKASTITKAAARANANGGSSANKRKSFHKAFEPFAKQNLGDSLDNADNAMTSSIVTVKFDPMDGYEGF